MSNMAQPNSTLVAPAAMGIERIITWVGSPSSLVVHTFAFAAFFATPLLRLLTWDTMFLVLTTVVSLEAIYLAIFIQFSVNRQRASLKGVEEDVESIQENVEELGEHVEGIKEDVEDIQEDIQEDISEEAAEEQRQRKHEAMLEAMLEALTNDVRAMLQHLEQLKVG